MHSHQKSSLKPKQAYTTFKYRATQHESAKFLGSFAAVFLNIIDMALVPLQILR